MKINDRFEITNDAMNFILVETVNGKNHKGEPSVNYHKSYFPKMELALQMIVTKIGKDASDLDTYISEIKKVRSEITTACSEKV